MRKDSASCFYKRVKTHTLTTKNEPNQDKKNTSYKCC